MPTREAVCAAIRDLREALDNAKQTEACQARQELIGILSEPLEGEQTAGNGPAPRYFARDRFAKWKGQDLLDRLFDKLYLQVPESRKNPGARFAALALGQTRYSGELAALLGQAEAAVCEDSASATADQYVTLDQAAALVNRSKKTLERRVNKTGSDAPPPDVEGGGGRAHEWRWSLFRPWLEKTFGKPLPERFPSRLPRR
jgi:hypothetical protein